MDKLELHQTVQCRNETSRWLTGVVADILDGGRLLVKVEGWPMALEFEEVKCPDEEEDVSSEETFSASSSVASSSPWRVQLPVRRRRFARRHRAMVRRRRRPRCPGPNFEPVKASPETSAHVFKTSEALEVGCCDCVELMDGLVYTDVTCPLCGIMNTTNAKKELRAMHQQVLRKPWRAPHKRNRNKLFWSALAYKKQDKQQKRARNRDRQYKACRLNGALAGRHTYALFD